MTLTVGSLCSGYGGIELALASVLDCDLAWFAEFEDAPATIMAHHHPGVPNLRDLTKVDWSTVEPVDVLSAGFPCQPFSHAGKRLGANDERHLWPYIAQAIDVLRPRLALLENVRGLLTAQGEPDPEWVAELARKAARWQVVIHHVIEPKIRKARRRGQLDRITRLEADVVRLLEQRRVALDTVRRARSRLVRAIGVVVRDLANLGYDCRWYGLRAADVGAAHVRFRVFLFAAPADSDDQARTASTGRHGHSVAGVGGSALTLLPTPVADNSRGLPSASTDYASLANVAASLLPTPTTQPSTGNGHARNLGKEAQLLPTPRATDGTKGGPNQRGSSGDLMLPSAVTLLPTPAVNDMGAGKTVDEWDAWTDRMKTAHGNGNGHGKSLSIEAARLLPIPKATNNENRSSEWANGPNLGEAVAALTPAHQQAWGQYAAAIARAERAIGRPAPPPTEPGPKGTPRLSPRFVEFLMMLPDGWVTDVAGLTRNEQLKMLGNGVVPAQCAAALRAFLWDAYGIGVAA